MLTKTELNKIRKLKLMINTLQAEISDIEYGVRSPSLEDNGSPPTRNISSSVETRAIRLAELRTRKEALSSEYERLCLQLDRDIAESNDTLLNSILTYRFIMGYSWNKVAKVLKVYSTNYLIKYYSVHCHKR